jgi:hypothetical protein
MKLAFPEIISNPTWLLRCLTFTKFNINHIDYRGAQRMENSLDPSQTSLDAFKYKNRK